VKPQHDKQVRIADRASRVTGFLIEGRVDTVAIAMPSVYTPTFEPNVLARPPRHSLP